MSDPAEKTASNLNWNKDELWDKLWQYRSFAGGIIDSQTAYLVIRSFLLSFICIPFCINRSLLTTLPRIS